MHSERSDTPRLLAKGLKRELSSPAGKLTILDGIDLSVAAGESIAIVGSSGAGKSTLLGLLAGLDRPDAGRVAIDGENLSDLDEDGRARLRSGRVGFVFQAFHLLPGLTALENVLLPLELAGRGDARAAALRALNEVGLGERAAHYPRQLSGGEQQRVAIARAFAPEPGLLFADEPTGNLDDATGARIQELLFRMQSEHATSLVLVTHDERLARRCDRRLRLEQGRLTVLETAEVAGD